jgi:hypothetical protein
MPHPDIPPRPLRRQFALTGEKIMSLVLYGIGSPLVVDFEESCARRNLEIAGAVKNIGGVVYTTSPAPTYVADELPEGLTALPFLVPIFTPGSRRLAVEDAERRGFSRSFLLVDLTATVGRTTAIGSGTFVNSGAIIGGAGTIGGFVLVNRSASIGHPAVIGDYASIGPGAVLAGCVKIGRGAVIGAGAIVAPEVTIGDNAVVTAGSVVTRGVPANCLAGWHPSRILKSDIVGYKELAA